MLWNGDLVENNNLQKIKGNLYLLDDEEKVMAMKILDNYPIFVDESLPYFGCKKTGTIRIKRKEKMKTVMMVYKLPDQEEIQKVNFRTLKSNSQLARSVRKYIIALLLLGCDLRKSTFLIHNINECRVVNIKRYVPETPTKTMCDLTENMLSLFHMDDLNSYISSKFARINFDKFESNLRKTREDFDHEERYEKAIIKRIEVFIQNGI